MDALIIWSVGLPFGTHLSIIILHLFFGCVASIVCRSAMKPRPPHMPKLGEHHKSATAAALRAWAAPDLWGEFITQTAQRWFQYLLGSLFCIRLIWKTVDSCPLYTNEGWPSDWAEATFIMWRSITFLWSNVTFYLPPPTSTPPAATLPMHIEQHHPPLGCKREGPGWHDVYCTSIWSWCILRCKQGFKLYAPPCQWLRVTLTICLSAAGWELREREEAATWPAPAAVCVCVYPCARHCCHASISFHMFHFYFSLYLCLPLRCMANGCSLVPSQRRDSAPAITANPAHFSRRQPLRKSAGDIDTAR